MRNDRNKAFWQRAAAFYNRAVRGDGAVYEKMSDRMRKYLSPEKDVLEVACGTGLITHRLGGEVHFWEATDFAEPMIRQAKKEPYPENVHFSVQDAAALPYADGTFDIAVIANALHVMPEPQKALSGIRRILRDDGTLLAPCFVREEGNGRRMILASLFGFTTYSKWNTEKYTAFLTENGFTIIESERIENGSRYPVCFLAARKS